MSNLNVEAHPDPKSVEADNGGLNFTRRKIKVVWRTVKEEVAKNPLRSFLTTMQTTAILIGVTRYMWGFLYPPSTLLYIPNLMFQADESGVFRADMNVIASDGPPIKMLVSQVYEVQNGTLFMLREVRASSVGSMQVTNLAILQTQKPTAQLLFCIHSTNIEKASARQRIILERDATANLKIIRDQLVSYKQIPDADLPQKPACPA